MNLEQLLKECAGEQEAARKRLFGLIAEAMFSLCCRYVKNRDDAEELVMDGFRKIFGSLSKFRYETDAGFYAWARRIMVNECLMFLRRENAFSVSIEQHTEEVQIPETALDKLAAAEIYEAILQLPAGYRTVFNMFEIEGYSHKEIAMALNISEGTSKSQLNKARNWLRTQLKKNEIHEQRKIQ